MMTGTRFLSARALASRSTPKVCSAWMSVLNAHDSITYKLLTIDFVVVIIIDLYSWNKTPSAIVF